MNYTIYRNAYEIHTCRPSGQQEKEIMVKDIVPFSFTSPYPVHLQIGDYIDVHGERYELYEQEEPIKESDSGYEYQMVFKAQYYKLGKWKYRGYDSANQLKLSEWELMGTIEQFLDIAVANANRKDSGWTKGHFEPDAIPQFLSFNSDNNILLTLDQLAKAFNTEWWVVNKTIHLIKRMEVSGIELEYGYDKGLRGGLKRTNIDTSDVFSQLYVQGSEQNLPKDYRAGQKRLQLRPKYGKEEIEHDEIFDDIRPERIGTITSITDPFTFSDSGIDFNINDQIFVDQNGKQTLPAKVSFLSGSLAGYNFDIAKGGYNEITKTIRILKNDLEKSFQMPSESLHPQVGDTYYVFDIQAPEAHLIDAQNRLLQRGLEYLSKNGPPKFAFDVPPDHFFFRKNNTVLTLGYTVHVKELDLLLNKDIRIVGYVRDLHEAFKYLSMSLSDFVVGSPINRQYAEVEKTQKALVASKVYDIQRARKNWKTTSELSTMLETLRAEMLLITIEGGAYSTDIVSTLSLTDFQMTAGQIIHEQFTSPNNGIWNVAPFIATLIGTTAKYVYVRASRTNNTAEVILSSTKIAVESSPSFYFFPFGVISSVIDGTRLFSSLKGYTKVTGGQIGTGIIVANNGGSWINLDAGTFNFENLLAKIAFTPDGVVLHGKIIATNAEFINLMVQNIVTGAVNTKRVSITAANNNIEILNALNQILIQIDDDSAFEGGPGIRAGILGQIYSTLGNQGFYTINAITNKRAYVRPDIIFTDGALNIGLGAQIQGDLEFYGNLTAGGLPGLSFTADIRESTDTYRYIYNKGIVTQRTKLT
jgi:hypothetical protein